MRKLIVNNIASLDGYYEGPNKNVMVLPMDAFFNAHNLERLRAASTLVLGATTYRGFESFWSPIATNPEASPAVKAHLSQADILHETARRLGETRKVVVSDSMTRRDSPWNETATIVQRAEIPRTIAELKQQPGTDILVAGSRTMWNHLLRLGLVDELYVMLGAAVVGGGTPLFDAGTQAALRLLSTRTHAGSHNVLLQYEVER